MGMRIDPVSFFLRRRGAGKRVVRCAKNRNKYLRTDERASMCINYRHSRAAIVDEHFLTGNVILSHGTLLSPQPRAIAMTELRVAVTVLAVNLTILFPRQLLGHANRFELEIDSRKIRFSKPVLRISFNALREQR